MNRYELYHHGIKGQKWGERRFQNADGSLTNAGRLRYRENNELTRTVNTATVSKSQLGSFGGGGGGVVPPEPIEVNVVSKKELRFDKQNYNSVKKCKLSDLNSKYKKQVNQGRKKNAILCVAYN